MSIDFRLLANAAMKQVVPYQPGKPVETLERELGITGAIKLASNENPLGMSQQARQAAQLAIANGHIYPDGGYYELKKALSQFLQLDAACITVGNGSENILELIVKAYLAPGDVAVLSEHAFLTIPILISSYGAKQSVATARDFSHDVEAMVNLIDEKTRIVFLVNPNNPTGTFTSKAEFQWLMEQVPAHVLVVVDEAYLEYIKQDTYPDTQSYLAHYPNLVISRTFSKVYGLAGLRLGYAISSPDIADMLNRARLPFNVNSVVAASAIAALHDQAHVKQTVELNDRGLKQIASGVQEMGLAYIPSVGNFLTVDVQDGALIYEELLRQGVIVRPLKAYGMPRHIRVSTGTEEQNARFLSALSYCLSLKKRTHHEPTC